MEVIEFAKRIFLETVHIFYDMSPFLLIGLFLSGIIHVYIPTERISAVVGKRSAMSVIKAALWGIPLPLCSCGVIPAALSLKKHGASKGATLSFLISTPETGVDSIAITYALLDPLMTIFRPIAAFITAVTSGLIENFAGRFEKEEPPIPETACHICGIAGGEAHEHSHARKVWRIFHYAFIEFLGDISGWLFAGIVAAGIISAIIPEGFFTRFIGGGFTEMLVMLLVGIPLYICASATTPIAASLIIKGISPGAALVFLLSGPATNIATLTMVWRYIGKKSAVVYIFSIAVVSILMGLLLNFIYSHFNFHPITTLGKYAEIVPHSLRVTCSAALFVLLLAGILRKIFHKDEDHDD